MILESFVEARVSVKYVLSQKIITTRKSPRNEYRAETSHDTNINRSPAYYLSVLQNARFRKKGQNENSREKKSRWKITNNQSSLMFSNTPGERILIKARLRNRYLQIDLPAWY